MADNQQDPVAPQEDGIRFVESLFVAGKTMGDLYQGEQNLGLKVKLEDQDTFNSIVNQGRMSSGLEAMTEDESNKMYGEAILLHDKYMKREFNPYELNGEYDHGKGTFNEQGKLKFFMPNESFLEKGPTNTRFLYGLDDEVKIQHEQQRAEDFGIIRNKYGTVMSRDAFDKRSGTNHLTLEYDKEFDSHMWRELKDGELGNAAQIKPFEWIGGAKELRSSWAGSAIRGTVSGLAGKTVQGVAGLMHFTNMIASGTHALFSDRTYNDIALNNSWNDFANEMSNDASAMQRQNEDESGHFYEGANAFLYGFWDGVGQFAPMIATGFALGAVGVGAKLATQLSISLGSMTVYDITRNDMLSKGYSAGQADGVGIIMGTITQMSENLLAGNLVQRFGVRLGQNMSKKMPGRFLAEALEESAEGGEKKFMAGVSEKVAKEMGEGPGSKWLVNRYAYKMNAWIRDPISKEYKSKIVKGAATAYSQLLLRIIWISMVICILSIIKRLVNTKW